MPQSDDQLDSNAGSSSEPANNFESNYSEIESINYDCLCLICEYLNVMDIVNLSVTCRRLSNFAKAFVWPKKAKQIIMRTSLDEIPVTLTFPLANQFSTKITQQNLDTAFSSFGEYAEDLLFELHYNVSSIESTAIWNTYMVVMGHCRFLRSLQFKLFDFNIHEIDALKDQIEKLEDLKELKLVGCTGIVSDWPAALKNVSKVKKLTLGTISSISRHFFEYFRNLTSLSIDFDYCKWQIDDFMMVFDLLSNSLGHLEISDKDCDFNDYKSVSELITEKLPNLKNVIFNGIFRESTMFIIRLPNLKGLKIFATDQLYSDLSPVMQTLSDIGTVEDLQLISGFFVDKGTPLNLNRLQCLSLDCLDEYGYSLLEAITRSHTPEFHSFEYRCSKIEEIDGLLKFLDSKKTFKTIRLSFEGKELAFLRPIIEILTKPCWPMRPFIHLRIQPFRIGEAEVTDEKRTSAEIIYLQQFLSVLRWNC